MKRVALFLLTNLGVMLVLGLAVNVLGLNQFLTANGLSLTGLLGFALVMGFGGAFIRRPALGSVAQQVLHTARGAVLVVRGSASFKE